jgi:hypothetical protein
MKSRMLYHLSYYIHIYIYIPWILKFVMATIGCGISHKHTKHTDKCRKNKKKKTQTQYDETTDKYFFKIL